MIQGPELPPPPPAPQFDPNLIFMNDGAPIALLIVLAALTAAVIILWPIMRALGRRLEGKASDPALRAEVEQLHARINEVDALHHRIEELEERVDFTERLLAQATPQGRVGAPSEGSGR